MTRQALITPCGDDLDDAGLTYPGVARQLLDHAEEADRKADQYQGMKMPHATQAWRAMAADYRVQATIISRTFHNTTPKRFRPEQ